MNFFKFIFGSAQNQNKSVVQGGDYDNPWTLSQTLDAVLTDRTFGREYLEIEIYEAIIYFFPHLADTADFDEFEKNIFVKTCDGQQARVAYTYLNRYNIVITGVTDPEK